MNPILKLLDKAADKLREPTLDDLVADWQKAEALIGSYETKLTEQGKPFPPRPRLDISKPGGFNSYLPDLAAHIDVLRAIAGETPSTKTAPKSPTAATKSATASLTPPTTATVAATPLAKAKTATEQALAARAAAPKRNPRMKATGLIG